MTRTALSVSGKTNAGVVVSAAQSADVVACEGEGGGVCRVCVPSAWLSSLCQVQDQDLLLTCLQQRLEQAAPAVAVCCSILPDLCIDVQNLHVALANIFISKLGVRLGSFAQSKLIIEDVFGDLTIFQRSSHCLSIVYIIGKLASART